MTKFAAAYPVTTPPPAATPGMVVHASYDLTAYTGTQQHLDFVAASNDEDRRLAALAAMPLATVKFYELPVGEPLFDFED